MNYREYKKIILRVNYERFITFRNVRAKTSPSISFGSVHAQRSRGSSSCITRI